MRYFWITIISCGVSFIIEKVYLYFTLKNKNKESKKIYYPSIWIVAIIICVCVSILGLKVLCESETRIIQHKCFSVFNNIVSSGMHLIILMLFSNFFISRLVKKQYKDNMNEKGSIEDCISVLYAIGIAFMGVYSWWYLSDIEVFLSYIAILLGKFVWFDMKKFTLTLSEMRKVFINGFKELITKHKIMIIFEVVVYVLLGAGLYYMKHSDGINLIWDLDAVCLGVALSGILLIYFAVLQDKREQQESRE